MAKNVVLKDVDGNELRIKLYRYDISLEYNDSDNDVHLNCIFNLYSTEEIENSMEGIYNVLPERNSSIICLAENVLENIESVGYIYKNSTGNTIGIYVVDNGTMEMEINDIWVIKNFDKTLV